MYTKQMFSFLSLRNISMQTVSSESRKGLGGVKIGNRESIFIIALNM